MEKTEKRTSVLKRYFVGHVAFARTATESNFTVIKEGQVLIPNQVTMKINNSREDL